MKRRLIWFIILILVAYTYVILEILFPGFPGRIGPSIGEIAVNMVTTPAGFMVILYAIMALFIVLALRNFKARGWLVLVPVLLIGGWAMESLHQLREVQSREARFGDSATYRRVQAKEVSVTLVDRESSGAGRCNRLCSELLMERHTDSVYVLIAEEPPKRGRKPKNHPVRRYFLAEPERCLGPDSPDVASRISVAIKAYRTVGFCIDGSEVAAAPDGLRIYDASTAPFRPRFSGKRPTIVHVSLVNGQRETFVARREAGKRTVLSFPPVVRFFFDPRKANIHFSIGRYEVKYGEEAGHRRRYGDNFNQSSFVGDVLGFELDSEIDASALPDLSLHLDLVARAASNPDFERRRDAARLVHQAMEDVEYDALIPLIQMLLADEDRRVANTAVLAVDPSLERSERFIPAILDLIDSLPRSGWPLKKLAEFDTEALHAYLPRLAALAAKMRSHALDDMLRILSRFGDRAIRTLVDLLEHESDATVAEAAITLSKLNSEASRQTLPSILRAMESVEGGFILKVFGALKRMDARDEAREVIEKRLEGQPEPESRKILERLRA